MTDKILVTYASRTGTTAGVADAIAKTLSENGGSVDVLPMQDVKDIDQYKSIVAGSAIQAAKWLPEAIEFLEANKSFLNNKPFAVFLVCMTLAMPGAEKYRDHVSGFMEPVRKMIKPVKEGLFAGRLDLDKLPSVTDRIKFRISVWMGVWKTGDHRNWNEINKWAQELKAVI